MGTKTPLPDVPENDPGPLTLMEKRNQRHKTVALTIVAVIGIVICVGIVAKITLVVNKNYEDDIAAQVAAKVAQQESQIVISDDVIKVQMGATIMTTVWYSKNMQEPIVKHALVSDPVCRSSKAANEQAMAQIKKAASAIFITCQNIQELDR